jgi:hypothetical protein
MDKRHISFSPIPDEAYISLRDHGFCALNLKKNAPTKALQVGDMVALQTRSGFKCFARLIAIQATGMRSFLHLFAPAL